MVQVLSTIDWVLRLIVVMSKGHCQFTNLLEESCVARLDISVDRKYFRADSINHGRLTRDFFETMTENVFNQSYRYWKEYRDLVKCGEVPLLHGERNLYSIFASAINSISPIHLSEWSFNKSDRTSTPKSKSDKSDKNRRVDFWCLNRDSANGKRINYFIEIKKTWYCLSEGTQESLTDDARSKVEGLVTQLKSLEQLKPDWDGDGDVFLGVVVIHGYYPKGKRLGYDKNHVRENVHNLLQQKFEKAQLLISTWNLPDEMEVQWDSDRCKFILIAGIAIS